MRIFLPFVFALLFLGWLVYRLIVRKDLKANKNDLYTGIFFIVIWVVLYSWLWAS
ncbi:hypothetical protein KIH23_12775 [Flavobacterium sp. CYK-55]|uniref:hypothetical protein n=1 Tax=Flavobacterium sp. CYK-55 TaxID=2835529 RepID=UPI001BCF6D73|nr:hypothetical protein [Flavobacterium sp. CYK-55]MBS7788173.1 hypothetical protein [Flavobacterium sp. CYK-55]